MSVTSLKDLSAKSLFYHPDLKAGTIVFSDDVKIKGDLEDTLKRSMTNFQQKTTHMTVVNGESKTLDIPGKDNLVDDICG